MVTNRPGLTRQTLIEAGLKLLDEVGLEGLTVRRLAAELGVQSPALYWHFKTKQELLDGMADAIVRAPGMGPPRPDESWQDWLLRRGHAYRQSLLARRDGARVVVQATSRSAETIRDLEAELAELVARGFTPRLAMRTIGSVTHYINGFVLQEQSHLAFVQPDLTQAPTLLDALQAGGTPHDAFEHGLRAMISGSTPNESQHRLAPERWGDGEPDHPGPDPAA